MIKKPRDNYESPSINLLQLAVNDIVTASGNNFFEWDWEDSSDNSLDDGFFN